MRVYTRHRGERVRRDAFLYLDPSGPDKAQHAQCGTCYAWDRDHTCALHGPGVGVGAGDSCGFYAAGGWVPGTPVRTLTSAEESGLVRRPVRCENCRYFGGERCGLFEELNRMLPDKFNLEVEVDPLGCCNAQEPR